MRLVYRSIIQLQLIIRTCLVIQTNDMAYHTLLATYRKRQLMKSLLCKFGLFCWSAATRWLSMVVCLDTIKLCWHSGSANDIYNSSAHALQNIPNVFLSSLSIEMAHDERLFKSASFVWLSNSGNRTNIRWAIQVVNKIGTYRVKVEIFTICSVWYWAWSQKEVMRTAKKVLTYLCSWDPSAFCFTGWVYST